MKYSEMTHEDLAKDIIDNTFEARDRVNERECDDFHTERLRAYLGRSTISAVNLARNIRRDANRDDA